MNISNVQGGQKVYPAFLRNTGTSSAKNTNATSGSSIKTHQSAVSPLRDRLLSLIGKIDGNDTEAENLLNNISKPDNGGILIAAEDMPDLKDSEAVARFNRISELFKKESSIVENKKQEIITQGRTEGKENQEILNDIVRLYDSQSDLYKLGRGWDGNLFSFKESSSAGWSSTIKYTTDVVNTFA